MYIQHPVLVQFGVVQMHETTRQKLYPHKWTPELLCSVRTIPAAMAVTLESNDHQLHLVMQAAFFLDATLSLITPNRCH
jgi:hypothetical protein